MDQKAQRIPGECNNHPLIRLVVICAALVREHAHARWRMLSERYPIDVTLLVPNYWEQNEWNTKLKWQPEEKHDGRFHVLPLRTKVLWGDWVFPSLGAVLKRLRPDLIYVIQGEMARQLSHTILCRDIYCRKAKIIFFTMNALKSDRTRWRFYHKLRWAHIRRGVEAAICHYPGCLEALRDMDFKKPIFLQTQVGVDACVFRPDENMRRKYRAELGVHDQTFLLGCAIRLTEEKGILDLLSALPVPNVDWKLLLVGEGILRGKVQEIVTARGISDRVIMTGLVQPNDVAGLMQAMDCLVHIPHCTHFWIETFSLTVAQAMAVGLPVIGSNPGSVSWQVREGGIIVRERDAQAVQNAIIELASDLEKRKHLGTLAYEQAQVRFCIAGLTDSFHSIIGQVLSGNYKSSGDVEAHDNAHIMVY
jgi:glycosyltransferase involved in cell wall biosynthesis